MSESVRREESGTIVNRLVGTDFDPDVQRKFFRNQGKPKARNTTKRKIDQALRTGDFDSLEDES